MKTVIKRQFGLLALLLMATPMWGTPAKAAQFDQTEITTPENFVVVAAPAGRVGYGLLILEQLKNDRPCWDEINTGSGPIVVNPLLTQFDFTGICGRSRDSNSYSLRAGGEELGLQYSLRVLQQGNDLVLVAAANRQRNVFIPIGRTNGIPQSGELAEIQLDPGWRLTRRTFSGRSTGHVYLTNDQPVSVLLAAANSPTPTAGPIAPPLRPNPQTPSNAALLPAPGSTSPLTGSPTPQSPTGSTASPGTPVAPVQVAPVQIPVPPPDSTRANSGNPLGRIPGSPSAVTPGTTPGTNSATNSGTTPATTPGTDLGRNPVTNPGTNSTINPGRNSGTAATTPGTAPGNNPATAPGTVPPVTTSRATLPPLPPNRPTTPAPLSPPAPPAPPASTTATSPSPITIAPGTAPTPAPAQLPAPQTPPQSVSQAPQTTQRATGIVYGYRVIVAADTAELQDRVRSLAPQTQIVTVNGQPSVQAGLFRDLNSAEELRQRLVGENLSVTIVPIR